MRETTGKVCSFVESSRRPVLPLTFFVCEHHLHVAAVQSNLDYLLHLLMLHTQLTSLLSDPYYQPSTSSTGAASFVIFTILGGFGLRCSGFVALALWLTILLVVLYQALVTNFLFCLPFLGAGVHRKVRRT